LQAVTAERHFEKLSPLSYLI